MPQLILSKLKDISIILLGFLLLVFIFPKGEIVKADGYCREVVTGAYHASKGYSRSYDYTTRLPRAGYHSSRTSDLKTTNPPVNYTDYYAPTDTDSLIDKYGWQRSFWNKKVSQRWENTVIQDAENYTPIASGNNWKPIYVDGVGWRFQAENGKYYQYRRNARIYWMHDVQIYDGSAPSISINKSSGNWTNGSHSVSLSFKDNGCAGYKDNRYNLSQDETTPGSYTGWSTSGSRAVTINQEGVWYLHVQARDDFNNTVTKHYGPYRIDKTKASYSSSSVSSHRYQNGNDYWVRPGDTIKIRLKGYDADAGIKISYLRLLNSEQDNRASHRWDNTATHLDEFSIGKYTDITAASRTQNSGGYREVEFTVKVQSNANNKDFDVQGYLTDFAGNTNGYFDTGKNIRVDGTAPNVTASVTSTNWAKSASTTLTFSDSRSGVNTAEFAWSTSTSKPSSWSSGGGTKTQSSQGVWYLHYQTYDNAGNYKYGYFGPYRVDTTAPSGLFSPNSASWTRNNISVTFDPSDSGGSGVKQWRYRVSSDNGATWGTWSGWINGDTARTITLSSTGIWKIQTEVVDNAGNNSYPVSGTYYIDKTAPYHVGHSVLDARYQNGSDYWVKPGDTVKVRLNGADNHSGLRYTYLRVYNPSNDTRALHNWTEASNTYSLVSDGVYATVTGANVTSESGNQKEIQFLVNLKSNSNDQNFDIQYYYADAVNNIVGYNDTGLNLKVDGTAPTVTADLTSKDWTNGNISVNLTFTDSRSGVKDKQYAWSTSTSSPSSWVNYTGTVTQTGQGVWYLHYRAVDNAGNVKQGYFGPYKIDKTKPSGSFAPNGSGWTKNNLTTVFAPSDSGGSGVNYYIYRISKDNGATYDKWSPPVYGTTQKTINLSGSGRWKIQALVYDNAGNSEYITSQTFLIDQTNPVGTIQETPSGTWTRTAKLTATGVDSHSGFKRIKLPSGEWVNGSTAEYNVDKNGTYVFEFEDNVGNIISKSFTVSNIDDVNPFVWSVTKSPEGATNNNVTITISAGDAHSGVDRIVLPNNASVYNSTASYQVTANGAYTFKIYDKVGNSYTQTVNINNIDKEMPELEYLTLLQRKNGTYQVTVTTSDENGIREVKLNNGQTVPKASDKNYYVLDNITGGKPTYITITDNAGNVTSPINFLDIPTLQFEPGYSPSKTMKDDVEVRFNGSQNLSYKLGSNKEKCTEKPCTIIFTKNGTALAINSTDKLASMIEFEINNIDKSKVNLVLEGTRNKSDISLSWNLTLTNTKLTCQSSSDSREFRPSGTSHMFTGAKEETYRCQVEGIYQGNLEKSNVVILTPDYSDIGIPYKPPEDMTKLPFNRVFMEKSVTGQFYFLNINRDNTVGNQKLVPVPNSLQ